MLLLADNYVHVIRVGHESLAHFHRLSLRSDLHPVQGLPIKYGDENQEVLEARKYNVGPLDAEGGNGREGVEVLEQVFVHRVDDELSVDETEQRHVALEMKVQDSCGVWLNNPIDLNIV